MIASNLIKEGSPIIVNLNPQEKEEILFHGGATQAGGPSESAGSKKSSSKKFQKLSQEDQNGHLPGGA